MGFWNCFEYCAFIAIVAFFIGRILPKRWFHAEMFPYASYSFEKNGKVGVTYFDIVRKGGEFDEPGVYKVDARQKDGR